MNARVRTVSPFLHALGGTKRISTTTYCAACGNATSGGKPYCENHVLTMPYARKVAARDTRIAGKMDRQRSLRRFRRLAREHLA